MAVLQISPPLYDDSVGYGKVRAMRHDGQLGSVDRWIFLMECAGDDYCRFSQVSLNVSPSGHLNYENGSCYPARNAERALKGN
jgi:hypothetical protein